MNRFLPLKNKQKHNRKKKNLKNKSLKKLIQLKKLKMKEITNTKRKTLRKLFNYIKKLSI